MDISKNTCYTYRRRVPYDQLTLADDFLFCKVMQNAELCKELLRRILHIEIEKIEYTDYQKTLDDTIDGKSIRMDVYVKDEKHTIFDIEMQTTDTKELPRRSRFYHSCIDKSQLSKGNSYNQLTDSFVIFICTFDLFGKGLAKYSFDTICKENHQIVLEDGRHTVFVNTKGQTEDAGLEEFLNYLNTGEFANSDFLSYLNREVELASKNQQWREEYDMLIAREQFLVDSGREEGREIGREIGREEGREEERTRTIHLLLETQKPETVADLLKIPLEEVIRFKNMNIQE